MNPIMTMDWNRKNMNADPTDAKARISRGKATFLTMPPLDTMVLVADKHGRLEEGSTPAWRRTGR